MLKQDCFISILFLYVYPNYCRANDISDVSIQYCHITDVRFIVEYDKVSLNFPYF